MFYPYLREYDEKNFFQTRLLKPAKLDVPFNMYQDLNTLIRDYNSYHFEAILKSQTKNLTFRDYLIFLKELFS